MPTYIGFVVRFMGVILFVDTVSFDLIGNRRYAATKGIAYLSSRIFLFQKNSNLVSFTLRKMAISSNSFFSSYQLNLINNILIVSQVFGFKRESGHKGSFVLVL